MTLTNLIHAHRNKLTMTDWDIYQFLTTYNKLDMITLNDISHNCHVSKTTIFRFCQKIGLSGFLELKAILTTPSMMSSVTSQISWQQSYHQIIDDIYSTNYQQLFNILTSTNDIFIFAKSEQELRIAKEFQRIFFPLHKKIFILPNNSALHAQLKLNTISLLIYIIIDTSDTLPIDIYHLQNNNSIYTVMIS